MADSTYYDDDDDKIARLMSMGFEISASQTALAKSHGDVSSAIDCLLSEGKTAGSQHTDGGEKDCEEDRGVLETILDDEAPIPADMMSSSSKRNSLEIEGVSPTPSKAMAASSDDEHSSSRRPLDPPADLEFAPGRNSPTPSYEIYRRKKALLDKLRSAGVTIPPSTPASLDPTQETPVSENESSVASHSNGHISFLEESKAREDQTDADNSEIEATSSSASPSMSRETSPVNRFTPPEFIGLEATPVEPAPVYDAVRIPMQTQRAETLSSHENVNSSTQEDGENSSIHPPNTIGSVREEQVGCIEPDTQQQHQPQQEENDDHDRVPWWKKHKVIALVVIIIIPVSTVTVATAATMANQKNQNSSSSKSLKLPGNTDSSEVGFNTTKLSTSLDPSFQPTSLENELFSPSPVRQNGLDHSFSPVGVDDPIEELTEGLELESVETTPLPTTDLLFTPTESPTTDSPTEQPTKLPTEPPTEPPTKTPTELPTQLPTNPPSYHPTEPPSHPPTEPPTESSSERPTSPPSESPTRSPTKQPTYSPTKPPTRSPTKHPTHPPTEQPTKSPTEHPTHPPTEHPTSALLVIGATGVVGVNALQFVTALRLERENVFVVHSHVLYGVTGTEKKTLLAMNLTGEYDSKVKRPYVVGGVDVGCTHQVMKLQPTMHITLISSNVETDFSSSKVQIDASNLQEYLPVTKANVRSGKYTALVTIGKSEISVTIAALGIDRPSRRELIISSEELSVHCVHCDLSDMSQLWVTWDKPGFCETEDCNPDPKPSPPAPLPKPITTKMPTEPKTKKPVIPATKKPIVPATKKPVEPVVKEPAPPKTPKTAS
eukprot:CAMPEP_0171336428 /NCGR_PEP_ID=MMETSP0878-20121228/6036_1 /TAXON_ID=67004 /ORGANISM="Thalassiosira weissflogii, Strain CCMP1336" /LENGTH=831 /DNA_ID=CAMNT_0011837907 /DNA_START=37 /DNA_END=2532 /DNA_ORIENTATION=-